MPAPQGRRLGGLPARDQLVRRRLGEQRVAHQPPYRPHWAPADGVPLPAARRETLRIRASPRPFFVSRPLALAPLVAHLAGRISDTSSSTSLLCTAPHGGCLVIHTTCPEPRLLHLQHRRCRRTTSVVTVVSGSEGGGGGGDDRRPGSSTRTDASASTCTTAADSQCLTRVASSQRLRKGGPHRSTSGVDALVTGA